MTVTADDKRSIILPAAQPGDRFDVELVHEGKIILTKLPTEPSAARKTKLVRKNGHLFGILGRQIDDKALAAALKEFP